MKESITKSRFRIFPLILISFLVLMLSVLAFVLIQEQLKAMSITNSLIIILILILWFITTAFFGYQAKSVSVYSDRIVFTNLLYPFIKKITFIEEYDYITIVKESSNSGTYDSMWLIGNNKLKERISGFYYSNYRELENSIQVKNVGRNNMGMFKQFFCCLGYRIKKVS